MVLVVVAVLVWNFSTRFQQRERVVTFSEFMSAVKGDTVARVVITGQDLTYTTKSTGENFRTYLPSQYDGLANVLIEKGVLKTYLSDRKHAEKVGIRRSGNGVRFDADMQADGWVVVRRMVRVSSPASSMVTVSAATWTSALLIGGYRWVQLSSPVTLVGNEYYLLNASVDGVDAWGDTISGSQITWDSQYVPGVGDTGYDFSRNGVYGGSIPAYNDSGAGGSIFPAANLGFNVVSVPEPATLSIMGIGMAAVLGFMRKQKR